MAEIVIDKDEAIALLKQAVDERGADYVYPQGEYGCTYERDGAPSCIVGHALYYKGIAPETLHELDEQGTSSLRNLVQPVPEPEYDQYTELDGVPVGKAPLEYIAGVSLTDGARLLLDSAQWDQDLGVPWGKAVEKAIAQVS